jgi:hypothetical protein
MFSLAAHGYAAGSRVVFSTTGALPTGLNAGQVYYVLAAGLTSGVFEVSSADQGTPNSTSGSQSGTHSVSAIVGAISFFLTTIAEGQTLTIPPVQNFSVRPNNDWDAGWASAISNNTGYVPTGLTAQVPQGLIWTVDSPFSNVFNALSVGTTSIGVPGEIRATNNITAYYSDERLKLVLGNITGALYKNNDVAARYGYRSQEVQVGVLAQEVQAVQPEIVVPAPFDIGQRDDGSEYSLSGENYLTVRYDRLIPLLIEAIKEQKAQVDALRAELDELKETLNPWS